MPSNPRDHWTHVYREKASTEVSWFQPSPEPSLLALDRLGAGPDNSLIDVGGGASNLVDALLERGWRDITVLDIAVPALDVARARIGLRADQVQWLAADITDWRPARRYDVWHDRAVFHFLNDPAERRAYRRALAEGLAPAGLAIIATFALDGPEKCSGLPVRRYDPAGLAAELGEGFTLADSWREEHVTPWGSSQFFNWCAFRRRG